MGRRVGQCGSQLRDLVGAIHVAFGDRRLGRGRIFYNRSLDGGVTWQSQDTLLGTAPLAEADHTRHKPVTQLTQGDIPLVNARITAVDLTEENAVESLPPHVRKAWTDNDSQAASYVIATPQQTAMFAGKLTRKDFEQLVEVPSDLALRS